MNNLTPAIDLEAAAVLLKRDISFPKKLLKILIESLPENIQILKTAYEKQDWAAIIGIAHKLRGGTSYCGAFRLQEACCNLENELSAGEITLRESLYKNLLSEMIAVQDFYAASKNLFD